MSADEKSYSFDGVTVDCENFRARKDGQNIALTPRAFDVLIFLIKNAGRTVEKQEIFDSVWKDTFVGDNALTKIIKEIRHALDDDASQPRYIETVPKRGYRFIANVKTKEETKLTEQSNQAAIAEKQEISCRERSETKESLPVKRKNFLLAGAIALGLLILAAGFFAFNLLRSETVAENAPIDSIAVLPFENASGNAELDYLSDGITENIINSLARLPNLRVVPRSTVFYYKNRPEDSETIGKRLKVRAVLTGRIALRGDAFVIQTELIDANRKAQIWGGQYNRPFADVINLQETIAREITTNLRLRLSGADELRLARRYTVNTEAYRLYLQGRFFWNKRTPKDIKKAVEYLQQAIALDANYALAYAALADAYAALSNFHALAPREAMPKAKEAALKALLLDNNLVEARAALGSVLMNYDWDFAGAEKELKLAVELNPNYVWTHYYYGQLLSRLGRHEEALAEFRRALEIDPLSLPVNWFYGVALYEARRYDESIAQLNRTLELDPNFAGARLSLSVIYQVTGKYAESVEESAKYQELFGDYQTAALMRESFARGGWQGFLQALTGTRRISNAPTYGAAAYYAALGEKDKAFAELEKSYEIRDFNLVLIKVDPRLDPLRDDPRFEELLRKVGFPQ